MEDHVCVGAAEEDGAWVAGGVGVADGGYGAGNDGGYGEGR